VRRWGYRIGELAEATGLSRDAVDAHARRRAVPRRKVGSAVLLEARAAEAAFGFGEPEPDRRATVVPSLEVLERAAGMMRR